MCDFLRSFKNITESPLYQTVTEMSAIYVCVTHNAALFKFPFNVCLLLNNGCVFGAVPACSVGKSHCHDVAGQRAAPGWAVISCMQPAGPRLDLPALMPLLQLATKYLQPINFLSQQRHKQDVLAVTKEKNQSRRHLPRSLNLRN